MTKIEFSTVISVLVVAGQVALVLGWLAYMVSAKFRNWSHSLFSERTWLLMTFTVALVSTFGSLAYSHIYELPVCMLCYYQRMFMYPQVLLLAIALYKKEYDFVRLPSFLLSLIGAGFAGFHYYYHVLGFFTTEKLMMPCSAIGLVPSCGDTYIIMFGYITIPLMALTAFLLMMSGAYLSGKSIKR